MGYCLLHGACCAEAFDVVEIILCWSVTTAPRTAENIRGAAAYRRYDTVRYGAVLAVKYRLQIRAGPRRTRKSCKAHFFVSGYISSLHGQGIEHFLFANISKHSRHLKKKQKKAMTAKSNLQLVQECDKCVCVRYLHMYTPVDTVSLT
jgi:hypothetical protein